MELKEVIDSGFFREMISKYFEYYFYNHYWNKDRLEYALCNSEEEKKILTRKLIAKAKKKIKELGHDELSFDFLTRCGRKSIKTCIDQEKDEQYWENHFYEFFISDVGSLTPFKDAIQKIEKISSNILPEEIDGVTITALERIQGETRDVSFLIESEEDMMNQIEMDIDNYSRTGYWDIDVFLYQQYKKQSDPLKLLFRLCELLVHLTRLTMLEEFIEMSCQEPNESNKTDRDSFKRNKSTIDFLIGNDIEKLSLLSFLIENYAGKKGKNIAMMILALKECKLIAYSEHVELFSALRVDFGEIGTDSGINKYLTGTMFGDKVYQKMIFLHSEKINKHIEGIPK